MFSFLNKLGWLYIVGNFFLKFYKMFLTLGNRYGGGPEICRSVIRCGLCGLSLQVDLHPLTLFINSYGLFALLLTLQQFHYRRERCAG